MQGWENILLGIGALILVFLFFPNVRRMLQDSKEAPKDWGGFLLPVGLVVLFVFFLIATL